MVKKNIDWYKNPKTRMWISGIGVVVIIIFIVIGYYMGWWY